MNIAPPLPPLPLTSSMRMRTQSCMLYSRVPSGRCRRCHCTHHMEGSKLRRVLYVRRLWRVKARLRGTSGSSPMSAAVPMECAEAPIAIPRGTTLSLDTPIASSTAVPTDAPYTPSQGTGNRTRAQTKQNKKQYTGCEVCAIHPNIHLVPHILFSIIVRSQITLLRMEVHGNR